MSFMMRAEATAFTVCPKKIFVMVIETRHYADDIETNIRDIRNSQRGILLVFQRPFWRKRMIRTVVFPGIAFNDLLNTSIKLVSKLVCLPCLCFNRMDILKKKYPRTNNSDFGNLKMEVDWLSSLVCKAAKPTKRWLVTWCPKRGMFSHRKNAGNVGMVPLIINPIYT